MSAAPPWGLSCPTPSLRTVTQAEVSTNFTGIEVSQLEELTACLQTGCLQESSPSLVCRLPVAPPPLAGGTLVGWGRQGVGETWSFRGQGGSLKGQGRRVSGYLNSKERWLSPRTCAGGSRQDLKLITSLFHIVSLGWERGGVNGSPWAGWALVLGGRLG